MEENCFFRLIDELFPTIFYSADKSLDRMNISHSTFTSAGWKMVEKKIPTIIFLVVSTPTTNKDLVGLNMKKGPAYVPNFLEMTLVIEGKRH